MTRAIRGALAAGFAVAVLAAGAACPDQKTSESADNTARGASQKTSGADGPAAATQSATSSGEIMVLEERYPDGKVQIRREGRLGPDNTFINHGIWTEFDEHGQAIGEMTYVDGILHGPITLWHPNGEKQGEGFFEDGEKEGTWQIWDEHGRKIREESFKDNVADGMWIYWDEEGNVTHYEHWVKGERHLETSTPPASTQPAPATPLPAPPPASAPASQPDEGA